MVGETVVQIKTAEPPVRKIQMYLFAQPPLETGAEALAHKQHPVQQLGIDIRAARMAIELRQLGPNTAKFDETINRMQKVILRDMIFQRKLVEQRCLRLTPRSHHHQSSDPSEELNQ